jgi:hypothetical protein
MHSQLFHSAKYRLHAGKILWFAFAARVPTKMKSVGQIMFQRKQCGGGVLWKTYRILSSFGAAHCAEVICQIPHLSCKN